MLAQAAVAQAAEKSLLGVSVVERLGTFLAEQRWRERCSSCLSTLEEAAVNASKHAQEKYRQFRQRVEEKLGVAGLPADIERSSTDRTRSTTGAASLDFDADTQRIHPETVSGSGCLTRGHDSPGFQATFKSTLDQVDMRTSASDSPSTLTQTLVDDVLHQNTEVGLPVGQSRRTSSAELTAEVSCPCRLPTPSGRQPVSTSAWRGFRKQLQGSAFSDPCPPATPMAQSVPAPPRSGAADFTLMVRDVVAAAQCQQQHSQHPHRSQKVIWSRGTPPPVEQQDVSQVGWSNRSRLPTFGSGLLLSSIGHPTKV